jgi:hypothetical protein
MRPRIAIRRRNNRSVLALLAPTLPSFERSKRDARLAVDSAIYRVRKAFDELPVEAEHLHANAGVELQRINIGKERVEKMIAGASFLPA